MSDYLDGSGCVSLADYKEELLLRVVEVLGHELKHRVLLHSLIHSALLSLQLRVEVALVIN